MSLKTAGFLTSSSVSWRLRSRNDCLRPLLIAEDCVTSPDEPGADASGAGTGCCGVCDWVTDDLPYLRSLAVFFLSTRKRFLLECYPSFLGLSSIENPPNSRP